MLPFVFQSERTDQEVSESHTGQAADHVRFSPTLPLTVRKPLLDKPELQHKPHSAPTSTKELNQILEEFKDTLHATGDEEGEEEASKESSETLRDQTEEEDKTKTEDETSPSSNSKEPYDSRLKRVAAFKIKSNSVESGDVPSSSPVMQKVGFCLQLSCAKQHL